MAVGWAATGPSVTAAISSLGLRATSLHMYAGCVGPADRRRQKMTPRRRLPHAPM